MLLDRLQQRPAVFRVELGFDGARGAGPKQRDGRDASEAGQKGAAGHERCQSASWRAAVRSASGPPSRSRRMVTPAVGDSVEGTIQGSPSAWATSIDAARIASLPGHKTGQQVRFFHRGPSHGRSLRHSKACDAAPNSAVLGCVIALTGMPAAGDGPWRSANWAVGGQAQYRHDQSLPARGGASSGLGGRGAAARGSGRQRAAPRR